MNVNIDGIDLTEPLSFATVVLCKKPNGFLVTFPQNGKVWGRVVNIDGCLWGEESPFPYMIFVPRNRYKELRVALDGFAKWRSKEDLDLDLNNLETNQTTIQEVISCLPKEINTNFMKVEPYSFQKLAVSWATYPKGKENVKGGLLADQMGLGKTLEGIATALYLKDKGDINNCLVICPATLKTQWQQEIEKFTNEESIIIQSNSKGFTHRETLFERVKNEKPFFTIINYELLITKKIIDKIELKNKTKKAKKQTKNVYGDYLDLNKIKEIGYDMVLIDEAHRMKNPDTKTTIAIREIEAKFKLLMTGTPIEKELKNIFQLFDYIDPSILSSNPTAEFKERRAEFESQFLLKRLNPFSYPAKIVDIFGEKNTDVLRKKINPFMLRRLTEDVSDEMPDQIEQKIVVDFSDYQLKMYNEVTKEMKEVRESIKSAKDDETREKLDAHFKGLSQFRTIICDSPSVLSESDSNIAKRIVGKRKSFPMIPKTERLLELIEDICFDNNQKVVIFTRYARVANYLNREIQAFVKKTAKKRSVDVFNTFVYEGNTKTGCQLRDQFEKENKDKSRAICSHCPFYNDCETRTKYAWHFQNDPNTKILIATDAANFGVNLQTGKYLINYDLPDSFSVYLQRNGRIRRLGSNHEKVFIMNLVTKNGVDEKKLEQLIKQMEINNKVIENKDAEVEAINLANKEIIDSLNEI